VRCEFGGALGGDGEQFFRAVALLRRDLPHLVEQGEGGIDHPGARRIGAAGQLLDPADQVIAVARLVGDQLEQHEPQFAAVEHPPPRSAASLSAVAMAPAKAATGSFAEAMAASAAVHAVPLAAPVAAQMSVKLHLFSLE